MGERGQHRIALKGRMTGTALLLFFFPLCVYAQSPVSMSTLHRSAAALTHPLNVLFVSLQPGYEYLAGIAYLSLVEGAAVTSVYVTNGEAGDSDTEETYPATLAAVRRLEADQAMEILGTRAVFLNMPDVPGSDSSELPSSWNQDTLQARLTKLVAEKQPDLVLFCRDWMYGKQSVRWQFLRRELLDLVKRLDKESIKSRRNPGSSRTWSVPRLVVDTYNNEGILLSSGLGKERSASVRDAAKRALECYRSLKVQYHLQGRGRDILYTSLFPLTPGRIRSLTQGLSRQVSWNLRSVESSAKRLGFDILKMQTLTAGERSALLKRVVSLLDTTDAYLGARGFPGLRDQSVFIRWKEELEKIRCVLLGVRVFAFLSDSVVTNRQVTFLRIDSVAGSSAGTLLNIYFPNPAEGWVINESFQRQFVVEFKTPFRLLSPSLPAYDLPAPEFGPQKATNGNVFAFFIAQRGKTKEESFVARCELKVWYAPRFTTEVLTPIVRVIPGERVIVRLTNHSRDGVADRIGIEDSVAASEARHFRLGLKEATNIDTLFVRWNDQLHEGDYLCGLHIGGIEVGRFVGRKFPAEIRGSTSVILISPFACSATSEAIRRLGVQATVLAPDSGLAGHLFSAKVCIVDHRSLSLFPQLSREKGILTDFVAQGGHLVFLSQDPEAWNRGDLWKELRLQAEESPALGDVPIVDTLHVMMRSPNMLSKKDWSDWIVQRADSRLVVDPGSQCSIVVKGRQTGTPLLVTESIGRGKRTFVNLALRPQFLNIHPGALRIFANVISQ